MLLPLRVEDAEVDRLPWVSISIAALCAVMFIGTWLVPRNHGQLDEADAREVLERLRDHPYLEVPKRLQGLVGKRFMKAYEALHHQALEHAPDPEEVEAEQRELDDKVAGMFRAADASAMRRLSLVPERGFLQLGLLTHMFLHFGWMHLLGNMLFFYIAGLLLEDKWGRGVFAGFYLVGGMVAAGVQYTVDRHSVVMIAGASGAIAACMGAFSFRFPMRQVRMLYWFSWFLRGTFLVRAWVWGLVWFAFELLGFSLDDGSSGVALGAHVGGFAFGAMVAVALKWSGVEEKYIAPRVAQASLIYERHGALDGAEAALARGDPAAARKELETVLAASPDSVDANVMLIKLEAAENKAAAHARAERFLGPLLMKDSAQAVHVVEELAPALDLALLRPPTAFRIGQVLLDRGPDGLRPLAEQLFASAGRAPGPFAAKGLLRAAQARLDAHGEARGAVEYLERLRALPGVPPDLLARVDEVEQRARGVIERERSVDPRYLGGVSSGIELEGAPAGPVAPEPDPFDAPEPAAPVQAEPSRSGAKVVECQLGGMSRDALSLVLEGGGKAQVSLANLLAVAVGVASEPAPPLSPPRNILYTDLVTSWGGPAQPAQVLRLKSSTLRLNNFYPGMKPAEAYGLFLSHLLDQSGATALPDAAAIRRGEYPRFPDAESFTKAIYG